MLPVWSPLDYPVVLAFALLTGLICAAAVASRPRWFWLLVLTVPLATAQIKMGRYCINDEIALAGIVIGGLLTTRARRLRPLQSNSEKGHNALFLVMVGYMIIQSFRGAFAQSDIRMVRWMVYYAMFGVLLLMINRWEFPLPTPRTAALIGTVMLIFSLGVYLIFGLYTENVLELGRWDTQEDMWAGSAAAVFPSVVGLPAIFFCLTDRSKWRRFLALLGFGIAITTANYYDSRILLVGSVAFLVAAPLMMGGSRVALLIGLLVFGFFAAETGRGREHPFDPEILGNYIDEYIAHPAQTFTNPDSSDQGRNVAFYAGWHAVMSDWRLALIGGGMYSHKDILPAFLDEAYGNITDAQRRDGYGGTTTGFTALLVDTGLIGLALFYANVMAAFLGILRLHSSAAWRRSLLLGIALGLVAVWPLASNILDHVLLYLAIMPGGILTLIGKDSPIAMPHPHVVVRSRLGPCHAMKQVGA